MTAHRTVLLCFLPTDQLVDNLIPQGKLGQFLPAAVKSSGYEKATVSFEFTHHSPLVTSDFSFFCDILT